MFDRAVVHIVLAVYIVSHCCSMFDKGVVYIIVFDRGVVHIVL